MSKQLELDGFNRELNLAFEHNGDQHYSIGNRFVRTLDHLEDIKAAEQVRKVLERMN